MSVKTDSAKSSAFWHLWRWPIVLGVLSATGLLTALVSDGWGDWWAWVALGLPVAVMAWFAWVPGRQRFRSKS
ncbi:hypothetical protein SAMN05216350_101430 [Polaromonas sp. YR568]|uniref:hypothetical protein n=1 Tax=Polaromonas sp. YR568 TaxID=1855301 RepID=UPI0008F36896|nr:hypothetical protein [Polaromonas sp. YR568]SFU34399.1 hypothetical protein SAMN05216350_101430 [Polaromonas sp. YR568]